MGVGTQERLILALALDWCSRLGSNPSTPTIFNGATKMHAVAYNRLFLFLAFVGGLWAGDQFSDKDGNASIVSMLVCGIAAIGIGFLADTYCHYRNNKNKPL